VKRYQKVDDIISLAEHFHGEVAEASRKLAKQSGREEVKMLLKFLYRHHFNLGSRSSDDYSEPAKCFCCGAMNELKIVTGIVYTINPLAVFDNDPRETFIEAEAIPGGETGVACGETRHGSILRELEGEG
jgi:hypothetical protein